MLEIWEKQSVCGFFIWILGTNLADKLIHASENISFTGCFILCKPSQNL
jgi:hypothetical protein